MIGPNASSCRSARAAIHSVSTTLRSRRSCKRCRSGPTTSKSASCSGSAVSAGSAGLYGHGEHRLGGKDHFTPGCLPRCALRDTRGSPQPPGGASPLRRTRALPEPAVRTAGVNASYQASVDPDGNLVAVSVGRGPPAPRHLRGVTGCVSGPGVSCAVTLTAVRDLLVPSLPSMTNQLDTPGAGHPRGRRSP